MLKQNILYKKGFTLVEILVVTAIISIFASMVLANYNVARNSALDAQRKSDLRGIQAALEFYYNSEGTYRVLGTGYRCATCAQGGGGGWVGYENGPFPSGASYDVAVTRELYNRGYLAKPLIDDPKQDPGYMLYLCGGGETYSLSATMENEGMSDADISASGLCNTTGSNAVHTRYGKNYVIGNGP